MSNHLVAFIELANVNSYCQVEIPYWQTIVTVKAYIYQCSLTHSPEVQGHQGQSVGKRTGKFGQPNNTNQLMQFPCPYQLVFAASLVIFSLAPIPFKQRGYWIQFGRISLSL